MDQKLLRDLFCLQCSLQFNGKYVFSLHQKLVHGSKDLDMKKEIIPEKSDQESRNDAKTNAQSPLLLVDEEFNCNDCNADFPSRSHLHSHIESFHEDKKQFKCNICDASFTQKGNLNLHIKSVHEGKKSFKCSICDYKFSRKQLLNNHMVSVHEEIKKY